MTDDCALAAAPPVLIVTENRVGRDGDGALWSADRNMEGLGWSRGLEGPGLALTARVRPREERDRYRLDVNQVHPMPYYVGLRGFLVNLPRTVLHLFRAISHKNASVVVVRVPSIHGIVAAFLSVRRRIPVAVEVVGDPGEVATSGALGTLGRITRRPLVSVSRWVVRQADAVRYMTQRVLQEAYPAAPSANVVALSSVSVPQEFGAVWSEVEKSLTPTIIAIGSQERLYKGHDLLIRALPHLLESFPDLRLELIGDGRCQPLLRRLADQLDVAGHVHFRGHIADPSEIARALSHAWLLAMPSRTEGLPRALVEACVVGTPAIGARAGGIIELLDDKYLFDREDVAGLVSCSRSLLASGSERQDASKRNREAARGYDPEHTADRLREWNRAIALLRRSSDAHRASGGIGVTGKAGQSKTRRQERRL